MGYQMVLQFWAVFMLPLLSLIVALSIYIARASRDDW